MSQSDAAPLPPRPSIRWVWILIIALIGTPVVLLTIVVGGYFAASIGNQRHDAMEFARQQAQLNAAKAQMEVVEQATVPRTADSAAAVDKVRPHLVRIRMDFQDFEPRFASALVVDLADGVSQLVAASEPFAPVTGKVNGRIVTRRPLGRLVLDSGPGMSGMMPGAMPGMGGAMSPMSESGGGPANPQLQIHKDIPALGLKVLAVDWRLSPIRILGDFPTASIGDTLIAMSLEQSAELTVLGIDESVRSPDGGQLQHLLKLTAWPGDPGAIVCNRQGDPIGVMVMTSSVPGGSGLSYAVPMGRLFDALYEQPPGEGSDRVSIEGSEGFGSPNPEQVLAIPMDSEPPLPGVDERPADAMQPAPGGMGMAEAGSPSSPKRTRFIRVPGRSPHDVARLLTDLFGDRANVAVDDVSGGVLITISRAETWNEVLFLLEEIEATAARLTAEAGSTRPDSSDSAGGGGGTSLPGVDTDAVLDRQARELAQRLRSAAPADQPALRQELEQLAGRHFELRQARRKKDIDELSQRIDKLRLNHQRRQQNKSGIIQRHLRELLDPAAGIPGSETGDPSAIPGAAAAPSTSVPSQGSGGP